MSWPKKEILPPPAPNCGEHVRIFSKNQTIDACAQAIREMEWPEEVVHDSHCKIFGNDYCSCGADRANAMREAFLKKINAIEEGK